MTLYARNEFLVSRVRWRTEFKDEETVQHEQLQQSLSDFFSCLKKREELFCRYVCRRSSEEIPEILQMLNSTILKLDDHSIKIRNCRPALTTTDRKTIVYNFCTKLVELLESVKEKLRLVPDVVQHIELEKQEILRLYKTQVQQNSYEPKMLSELVSQFPRPITKDMTKKASLQPESASLLVNKFVMSTQMLSNQEKERLTRFVKLKQKEQQRKAKIEETNKEEMKNLWKKAKKIYKVLDCQDVLKEQFCLTMTKQQNLESLFQMQLARNTQIQQQIQQYREDYNRRTLSPNKTDGNSPTCIFRIKKKLTALPEKKPTIFENPIL